MSREYKVCASSMTATFSAGRFVAETPKQACDMARDNYAQSLTGRALKDARAFRFYTVSRFPHEEQHED